MWSSVEHVCACAVYVFVLFKILCYVGNIAGIQAMARAGPSVDDLLATFWQRFLCFFGKVKETQCIAKMFGFERPSRFEISQKSIKN